MEDCDLKSIPLPMATINAPATPGKVVCRHELELAAPVVVRTEHGDTVEIPAGTVFVFNEEIRSL